MTLGVIGQVVVSGPGQYPLDLDLTNKGLGELEIIDPALGGCKLVVSENAVPTEFLRKTSKWGILANITSLLTGVSYGVTVSNSKPYLMVAASATVGLFLWEYNGMG